MTTVADASVDSSPGFRHGALLYADEGQFVDGTAAFVRSALAADSAIMVALPARRLDLLRSALDGAASRVSFVDMGLVGVNPARIIPAWQEFLSANESAPSRAGIGEPIWPGRTADEVDECHRHEGLINLAFADAAGFDLLCPYNVRMLSPGVVDEAHRTHPEISRVGTTPGVALSDAYAWTHGGQAFEGVLAAPDTTAVYMAYDGSNLRDVRDVVMKAAQAAGLTDARSEQVTVAMFELATNSVRHGGGSGELRSWLDGERLVLQVSDSGYIKDPLAGRRKPTVIAEGGRGLWIVNQLVDLMQIRSGDQGTTVRVHVRLVE